MSAGQAYGYAASDRHEAVPAWLALREEGEAEAQRIGAPIRIVGDTVMNPITAGKPRNDGRERTNDKTRDECYYRCHRRDQATASARSNTTEMSSSLTAPRQHTLPPSPERLAA